MSSTRTALAVAVLLALTACGTAPGAGPVASGTPADPSTVCASAGLPDQAELYELEDGEPLAAGVVPTAVVECVLERRRVAGDGEWSFVVTKRATSGLDAFVATLRRPDEPTPTPLGCTSIGYTVPWFAVVDASGRTERTRVPATACGQPQEQAMAALTALPFVEVSAQRRTQVRTEAETTRSDEADHVGCVDQFKDMVAIDDEQRSSYVGDGSVLGAGASGVTLCRFGVVTDRDGTPTLVFRSGEKLAPAASAKVISTLEASGPEQPCTVAHTLVVGIFSAQNGWALVEGDGCHRVHGGDGAWRQASAELLALLR